MSSYSSTLSSATSASSTLSSASSSEDFWHNFTGSSGKLPDQKKSLVAALRIKLRKLWRLEQPAAEPTARHKPAVSRDKFDEVIKEFEITLNQNKFREDFQYIQEYTHNFNTWHRSNQFQRILQVEDPTVYDDVFSDYSDVHESDLGDYSDVCNSSDLDDYSDVYSDYSRVSAPAALETRSEDDLYYSSTYGELLPPPLPRRMSDTRPPARPPVPSCTSRSRC